MIPPLLRGWAVLRVGALVGSDNYPDPAKKMLVGLYYSELNAAPLPPRNFPMARYTCSFTITRSRQEAQTLVEQVFQACELDTIYAAGDYLVARETPGKISFDKLVTVEALIDGQASQPEAAILHFIIKSEELPLQADNHCRQLSERLSRILSDQAGGSSTMMETLSGVTG